MPYLYNIMVLGEVVLNSGGGSSLKMGGEGGNIGTSFLFYLHYWFERARVHLLRTNKISLKR